MLFNALAPLGRDPSHLEYLAYQEVKQFLGGDLYNKPEAELIAKYNSSKMTPQLVFLGLDEHHKSGFKWRDYHGAPHFALDVTPKGSIASAAESLIADLKSRGLQFVEGRLNLSLPASQAAIYGQARALLDWNARNPFCAQCGQPTLSINAGTKRTCPPNDMASLARTSAPLSNVGEPPRDRPDCATRKGISNISFPRVRNSCAWD